MAEIHSPTRTSRDTIVVVRERSRRALVDAIAEFIRRETAKGETVTWSTSFAPLEPADAGTAPVVIAGRLHEATLRIRRHLEAVI